MQQQKNDNNLHRHNFIRTIGTRVSVYYNKLHQRKKQRRGNVCQAIARKKERVFLRPHS